MRDAGSRIRKRIENELGSQEGFGLVETMIAFTILVIGLIAVSGLTLASSAQARIADRRSDVATAGQIVIETMQYRGYDSAISGSDTVSVGGRDYPVTLTVTDVSSRIREIQAVVEGSGPTAVRTFTARVYRPRRLPMPYDPLSGSGGGGGGSGTDSTSAPPDSTITTVDSTTVPAETTPVP